MTTVILFSLYVFLAALTFTQFCRKGSAPVLLMLTILAGAVAAFAAQF